MTLAKIVDISVAQPLGSIDFAKAKLDGVVGCIVRAEYGKSIDAYFHRHIEAAMAAGMRVGAYAFQMTDADPTDEVAALANDLRLAGYALDYGVSLDVETLNHQAPGNVVTWADAYIEEMQQQLGQPFGMLYTGPGFWRSLGAVGQTAAWAARKLWVANYGVSSPMLTPPWGKWQQPGGPVLWQAYGNTIWKLPASGESKWGKACPGPGWVKIASAYPAAWSAGEVDVSVLPGDDDAPLLVNPGAATDPAPAA